MPVFTKACRAALGLVLWTAPELARAETAEYRVTFESTWSAQTHPHEFPTSAHFSGLIGGTHNDQVSFWQVGSLASQGIQDMAEMGSKTALQQEVQAAIAAGTANAVLSGGGISPSPGSVSLTFDVEDAFPLVTLVSMLAPSPDWFVGVSGLDLHPNGTWIPQVTVDLALYDAGTDSGPSFTSPNQATVPHVLVAENTSGAFASNNHVGTFTFTLNSVLDVPPLAGNAARLDLLGANPIGEDASFRIQVPAGRTGDLAVYSVTGQRVRSLFHGATAGRASVVRWNGRSDEGARVPPGAYFVALRVDGAPTRVARVAVVR